MARRKDDKGTLAGALRRAEYFRSLLAEVRNHDALTPCNCGHAECLTYRIDMALSEKSA